MIEIHNTSYIDETEGYVKIGNNTSIGPFCYIKGPIEIGNNNKFQSHCSIGLEPEHKTKTSSYSIRIGDNNFFSNHVSIHRGTDHRETTITNNCFIMNGTHISHDCFIDDGVIISSMVTMGGHTTIQKFANLGMNACIHQFSTIGAYSMIGMGSVVVADIPPFAVVCGNPAKKIRNNTYQLQKLNIADSELKNSELYIDFYESFLQTAKRKIIA